MICFRTYPVSLRLNKHSSSTTQITMICICFLHTFSNAYFVFHMVMIYSDNGPEIKEQNSQKVIR